MKTLYDKIKKNQEDLYKNFEEKRAFLIKEEKIIFQKKVDALLESPELINNNDLLSLDLKGKK